MFPDIYFDESGRRRVRVKRFESYMAKSPQLKACLLFMIDRYRQAYAPWFAAEKKKNLSRRWHDLMSLDRYYQSNRSAMNLLHRGPFLRREDASEILAELRERAYVGPNSLFKAVFHVLFREKRVPMAVQGSLMTLRHDIQTLRLIDHIITKYLNSAYGSGSMNLKVSQRRIKLLIEEYERIQPPRDAEEVADIETDENEKPPVPEPEPEEMTAQYLAEHYDYDEAEAEHLLFFLDDDVPYQLYKSADEKALAEREEKIVQSEIKQARTFRHTFELIPVFGQVMKTKLGKRLQNFFYELESLSTNPYALRFSWGFNWDEDNSREALSDPLLHVNREYYTLSQILSESDSNDYFWELCPNKIYLKIKAGFEKILELLYFDHEVVKAIHGFIVPYNAVQSIQMFVNAFSACLGRAFHLEESLTVLRIDIRQGKNHPRAKEDLFTEVNIEVDDPGGLFELSLILHNDFTKPNWNRSGVEKTDGSNLGTQRKKFTN